jgi:hypothetical protein
MSMYLKSQKIYWNIIDHNGTQTNVKMYFQSTIETKSAKWKSSFNKRECSSSQTG